MKGSRQIFSELEDLVDDFERCEYEVKESLLKLTDIYGKTLEQQTGKNFIDQNQIDGLTISARKITLLSEQIVQRLRKISVEFGTPEVVILINDL
jgi:cell division FtsZ-interacting protein ZapD